MARTAINKACPKCGRHTLVIYTFGTVFCTAEKCSHNIEPVELKKK